MFSPDSSEIADDAKDAIRVMLASPRRASEGSLSTELLNPADANTVGFAALFMRHKLEDYPLKIPESNLQSCRDELNIMYMDVMAELNRRNQQAWLDFHPHRQRAREEARKKTPAPSGDDGPLIVSGETALIRQAQAGVGSTDTGGGMAHEPRDSTAEQGQTS